MRSKSPSPWWGEWGMFVPALWTTESESNSNEPCMQVWAKPTSRLRAKPIDKFKGSEVVTSGVLQISVARVLPTEKQVFRGYSVVVCRYVHAFVCRYIYFCSLLFCCPIEQLEWKNGLGMSMNPRCPFHSCRIGLAVNLISKGFAVSSAVLFAVTSY